MPQENIPQEIMDKIQSADKDPRCPYKENFTKSAIFGYQLRDEEVKELKEIIDSRTGEGLELCEQLQQKKARIKEMEEEINYLKDSINSYSNILLKKEARIKELEEKLGGTKS